MKIVLIANASASSVTARTRVVIQKALSADHEVELAETVRRGHATRIAQGAAAKGVDVVAVLGGDGTLNEAANGIAGTSTALAPLPGGSTNVFARTLGLPEDPVHATAVTLEALDRGSIRTIGLGSANERYFLFHCGVGYDAAVVEQVEKRGQLKRWAGHPLFAFAAVDTWLRHYDRKNPHFTVHFADDDTIDKGYFAICLNTDPYTYLGTRPFSVAPAATLDRPMSVITLTSLGAYRLGRLAYDTLRSDDGVSTGRGVDLHTDVRAVTMRSETPFPFQLDGDFLGEVTEIEFAWEPDMLHLVVPDGRNIPRPPPVL
ncbi:MAG: diacylglycerol/lipid kinase family protein [Acidimicrobiales bacterium]